MSISKYNKFFIMVATIVGLLITVAFAFTMLSGRSLIIPIQMLTPRPPETIVPAEAGKTVCVLKNLDLETGAWSAYIITDSSDLAGLPDGVPRHNFLELTDKMSFKEMQRDWCFEVTGGDLGTIESYIAIFQNDELRWESGIVISPNYEGLQSSQYGWVIPKSKNLLLKYAKKFSTSVYPLHVI